MAMKFSIFTLNPLINCVGLTFLTVKLLREGLLVFCCLFVFWHRVHFVPLYFIFTLSHLLTLKHFPCAYEIKIWFCCFSFFFFSFFAYRVVLPVRFIPFQERSRFFKPRQSNLGCINSFNFCLHYGCSNALLPLITSTVVRRERVRVPTSLTHTQDILGSHKCHFT